MAWLRGIILALACGSVMGACSSGTPQGSTAGEETLGSSTAAITAACGFNTIGLPCDPDGPAGPKLECEGACAIATSGLATCQAVAAGALNGVICGTINGIGDAACKRYCSGKTCLAGNAPAGAACRPTSKTTPCDGQCDGAGKCDNLGAAACEFGRDEQLCKFVTCSFKDSSQCITKNLARNTLCSDSDVCEIGKCNNVGVCVSGGQVGCDDGNSCTDDSCDPVDGGCVGVIDDTNECEDGNACTTGDLCAAGGCVAGATATNCDDSNACTADSCDPNTGCAHIGKSCDDGDACTDDACDPGSGACSHTGKTCNDNNLCTNDSCNSATGCQFAPINCDDSNACTADSCTAGVCDHPTVTCNDSDICTNDSCDAVTGCVFAPILGCGVIGGGGAGGEASGGAPSGVGGAGEAGDGPTTGGVPGTGGAPTGEAGALTGEAGAPVAEGGAPSSEAGAPAVAGSAGTGQGGMSQGGVSQGGNAGTQTAGSSGLPGTAGSSSNAGGADGGADSVENSGTHTVEDGGCGCRAAGSRNHVPTGTAALLLVGLTLARRRRA